MRGIFKCKLDVEQKKQELKDKALDKQPVCSV